MTCVFMASDCYNYDSWNLLYQTSSGPVWSVTLSLLIKPAQRRPEVRAGVVQQVQADWGGPEGHIWSSASRKSSPGWSSPESQDEHKDTVIGRIYYGWDYNRFFPCMEATFMPWRHSEIQEMPLLWVPWAGSLWHKRAGVATLWAPFFYYNLK